MQQRPIRPPDLNGSFLTAINGPAGRPAGGRSGDFGAFRACGRAPGGPVGAPDPPGDGPGRRDGRNEGLGGSGARPCSRVVAGYRAGGEGTQVAEFLPEDGTGPGTWFLNRLAACFVIPKPVCRRTRKKALFFDKPAHEASSKLLIQLRKWDLG